PARGETRSGRRAGPGIPADHQRRLPAVSRQRLAPARSDDSGPASACLAGPTTGHLPVMNNRPLSRLDRVLVEIERALGTTLEPRPAATRSSPAAGIDEGALDESERRHAGGLMRVNHVGEVCAQALYSGQAAVARDARTRAQLLDAAAEETDHLAWCGERLQELGDRASLLNPLW